ncbi:MAG: hypothetical protein EXR70_02020 [Deltaproteobacteria bacterium]|nr:hypothetical protein [Deltaproteobacteria bacterium]
MELEWTARETCITGLNGRVIAASRKSIAITERQEPNRLTLHGSGRCLLTATRCFLFCPNALAVNSQANNDELRVGSMREDLPLEILPPLARRRKDKDYLLINRPEMMDFKPIQTLLDQFKKSK